MPYSALYVFGDSLSDPGNVFAVTGGALPPTPPYAGRFSNGPTAPEYLSQRLGLNAGQVFNVAQGGALTGSGNLFDVTGAPGLIGVRDQIDAYAGSVVGGGASVDPTALYIVWAGANNFFFGVTDPVAAVTTAVTDITTSVGTLAALGARTILVPNLPNLGATPMVHDQGPIAIAGATALSLAFNNTLAGALTGLDQSVSARIVQFDVFGLFSQVAANPSAFGFENVADPCLTPPILTQLVTTGGFDPSQVAVCANPNVYLFWDEVHPSTTAHRILAAQLAAAVPEPSSAALLLLGVALLGRRARCALGR